MNKHGCSWVYVGVHSCTQKLGYLIDKQYKKYENDVSCFGTKPKHCKTIYILKGYTDSYSDLNRKLQIDPYYFQNCGRNHRINDDYLFHISIKRYRPTLIRSDSMVKKNVKIWVNRFLLSDMSFSKDKNSISK